MPKRRMKRHAVTQPQDPSYKIIPLTKGQNTLVDFSDYDWLNQWNWTATWNIHTHSFYAYRKGPKNKSLPMARCILRCGKRTKIDHANHDTLDNRRQNLRKAKKGQNEYNHRIFRTNTSGYIGVSWHKSTQRWRAYIIVKRKQIHLGGFQSSEVAAKARDEGAKKFHGKFANLNF